MLKGSRALPAAVLLVLCCATDQRRTTPFPLTKQLEPVGGYVVIYSPRRQAHFEDCSSLTITFEVIGIRPDNERQIAALVYIGDANPVPMRLDSAGPKSLRAHFTEPGKWRGFFSTVVTSLCLRRAPDRFCAQDFTLCRQRLIVRNLGRLSQGQGDDSFRVKAHS